MTSTDSLTDSLTNIQTLERFRSVVSALAELPTEAKAYLALDETDLLELNRLFATSQRILRSSGALIAGEIAHRSTPELGSEGLAQRAGHRTPEQFIKITTGATSRDAVTAVRVGVLMREAATSGEIDPATGEVATPAQPWLAPVTSALCSRSISIEVANAIRVGLGAPNLLPTRGCGGPALRGGAESGSRCACSRGPSVSR
jgi:hypothetical protein